VRSSKLSRVASVALSLVSLDARLVRRRADAAGRTTGSGSSAPSGLMRGEELAMGGGQAGRWAGGQARGREVQVRVQLRRPR
jgi:hypothetical protein